MGKKGSVEVSVCDGAAQEGALQLLFPVLL